MPARWFCLRMRLLCCYNRASVSRRRVDRERVVCIFFFPPVFQIRFSTSKQQEIHCDPQSFAVHALIRADNTRCSNNFPHYRGSHRPSSEPIKTAAFRPKGGDHRRGGVLISPGQTQALTLHLQQVLVIKVQPLHLQSWNQTKVIGKCHLV